MMQTNHPQSSPVNSSKDPQQLSRQIQELAELKNAFIALVSHELRTPLNILTGYLKLGLELLEEDTEQAKDYLQEAERSTQRLTRIVQELTDFANLQRGKEITHIDPIPIEDSFQQTIALLKPNLEKKNLRMIIKLPERIRKLEYDGESMMILFRNILSNAAKFSPQNSEVIIDGKFSGRYVVLSFHDQADPIPEMKREIIFKDFRQLENYLTRRYEGMGLGLAVARRTARFLGGDIHLRVRDQGNTFEIKLPLQQS